MATAHDKPYDLSPSHFQSFLCPAPMAHVSTARLLIKRVGFSLSGLQHDWLSCRPLQWAASGLGFSAPMIRQRCPSSIFLLVLLLPSPLRHLLLQRVLPVTCTTRIAPHITFHRLDSRDRMLCRPPDSPSAHWNLSGSPQSLKNTESDRWTTFRQSPPVVRSSSFT